MRSAERTSTPFTISAELTSVTLGVGGTACFVARHLNPERWDDTLGQQERVYRLGKCYGGPAISSVDEHPRIEVCAPDAMVLGNVVSGGARTLATYTARGGYKGLELALHREADHIISAIEASGLRGRGGAGFRMGTTKTPRRSLWCPMRMKVIPAPISIAS